MRKMIVLAMVMLFCLVGMVEAGKMDSTTASAGMLLVLAQQQKIAILTDVDTTGLSVTILVEPLWWKTLTHRQKVGLVNAAMAVAGEKRFVYINDMTSRDTVAEGWINERRVKIYK